jgi:hypothetical protein
VAAFVCCARGADWHRTGFVCRVANLSSGSTQLARLEAPRAPFDTDRSLVREITCGLYESTAARRRYSLCKVSMGCRQLCLDASRFAAFSAGRLNVRFCFREPPPEDGGILIEVTAFAGDPGSQREDDGMPSAGPRLMMSAFRFALPRLSATAKTIATDLLSANRKWSERFFVPQSSI